MRISILATGSLGDIIPYLTIAKKLLERNHDVSFATAPVYEEQVKKIGARYVSLSGVDPNNVWSALASNKPTKNPLRMYRYLYGEKTDYIEALRLQAAACVGVDLVVVTTSTLLAAQAAVKLGVPVLCCHVTPLEPTSAFSRPIGPYYIQRLRLGNLYNILTHEVVSQLFWSSSWAKNNIWRQEDLKEPPLPWLCGYRWFRRLPFLFGFSEAVIPRPNDWPNHYYITGYWLADEEKYAPSNELINFLSLSGPIAFVGFGSQIVEPSLVKNIIIPGLHLAGYRVILGGGWSDFETLADNQTTFFQKHIPYRWIFPRVSLAVHHCGAGTIAEALRSNIANISVPFTGEQRFWSERLFDLGVSQTPFNPKSITPSRIAYAAREAMRNQTRIKRIEAISASIRRENGVSKAVSLIEQYGSSKYYLGMKEV